MWREKEVAQTRLMAKSHSMKQIKFAGDSCFEHEDVRKPIVILNITDLNSINYLLTIELREDLQLELEFCQKFLAGVNG